MFCVSTLFAKAQIQPFGKIDKADLEMKECSFEKDANAEVLFDKGDISLVSNEVRYERHTRIKIFNDKGKDQANIKISYFDAYSVQLISQIQAQTINLKNGNIEYTNIDKKLIYTKPIDKYRSEITFSFPDVQAGSVIEFKYTVYSKSLGFPDWYFQKDIPVRYSEITNNMPGTVQYKTAIMVKHPFVQNTDIVKSMANLPALRNEPYMNAKNDNADRVLYEVTSINGITGILYQLSGSYISTSSNSWKELGQEMMRFNDFGYQLNRRVSDEDVILNNAKTLKDNESKIAYIFNAVKNAMKWNDIAVCYTETGTSEAWNKKIGNSTEINLIVYHLLQKLNVPSYPMLVSTKDNGKVIPTYPSRSQFNKTVTYVPIDAEHFYVLDATSKYNTYREIPEELLNTFGFFIDSRSDTYELMALQKPQAVRNVISISGDILPTGKISGHAHLTNFSYNRINAVQKYIKEGEKKYLDYLRNNDNALKISSIKFENMDVDTLPLIQKIDYDLDLIGSDENYIYFNPNIFTGLHSNPFINETRTTDINFGYLRTYQINGNYKIPAGYKIDALPKSISITMPDNSISFRRVVAEQDASIVIAYVICNKQAVYFKEDYASFREFYRKMYEMLNEQIVFKKS